MKKTLAKSGLLAVVLLGSSVFMVHAASADTTTTVPTDTRRPMPLIGADLLGQNHDAVMRFLGMYMGKVTAVSGTTLTITDKDATTITVQAANAAVMRNGVETPLSSVAVNDALMIRGTMSGSTITAEKIVAMSMSDKKEKVMTTVKKIMKEGLKDMKQGMKDRRDEARPPKPAAPTS
ncbi:MAG TPA: hypothetical protein VGE63_00270 [Candidatus Paceibacterota bacterium]